MGFFPISNNEKAQTAVGARDDRATRPSISRATLILLDGRRVAPVPDRTSRAGLIRCLSI